MVPPRLSGDGERLKRTYDAYNRASNLVFNLISAWLCN